MVVKQVVQLLDISLPCSVVIINIDADYTYMYAYIYLHIFTQLFTYIFVYIYIYACLHMFMLACVTFESQTMHSTPAGLLSTTTLSLSAISLHAFFDLHVLWLNLDVALTRALVHVLLQDLAMKPQLPMLVHTQLELFLFL